LDDLIFVLRDDLFTLVGQHSGGSDLLVDGGNDIRRTSKQRGSSISDGVASLSSAKIEGLSSKVNVIQSKLPVGFVGQWNVRDGTGVSGRVESTKSQFSSNRCRFVSAEPEGKNGLGDQLLGQKIVPNRDNSVFRDGLEGKSKDSIKLSNKEGNSGLSNSFGKNLILDGEATKGDIILRKESSQRSSSVLNGESLSIGNVGARGSRVVLVMEVASQIKNGTAL